MSGGSPTELLADFKLPNGRYVWIMHYTIPAPSGRDMQRVRARAKEEWLDWQRNGMVAQILPKTRIGAVTDCSGGSFAEMELAADFLREPKRRRA